MEENVTNGKVLWSAKGEETIPERKTAGRDQVVRRTLMITGVIVGAFLLIGAMVATLCAQSYPNKPIRLILPMGPGGGVDILGRIVGQKLSERLGQPVVPENHPGAGGTIGYELVAKAKPDGYTLLLGGPSLSSSPSLYRKLKYDPARDLAPIALVAQTPHLLVVRPSLPINSLKELVQYAKANPGKLNFGSSGVGSSPHLAAELLKSLAKINIVHVPYKGAGQSMIGLMGGEIDMVVMSSTAALPHIQAGRAKVLALVSNERVPSLPNVPTAKEAGIDDYEVIFMFGILAPAGTPRDIINRLNAEWNKSATMPDTVEKMQKAGVDPVSSTPERYFELIKADIARWAKVAKEANIRLD